MHSMITYKLGFPPLVSRLCNAERALPGGWRFCANVITPHKFPLLPIFNITKKLAMGRLSNL